jgi:RNA polymerase sigma-70 factor (ECF subfamily)
VPNDRDTEAARLNPPTEEAVRALAPATPENIERLFRDHNEALLRFLRAKLHSSQEALDVAQEAYVQLLGLRNPSTVSYLQAYLFKTAENLANNRLKYGTRRKQLDELVFFETETAKSPEYGYAAEQELDVIDRALNEMPVDVVRALVLVKFDGMSFEQAAKVMGLSGLKVSRFVSRALIRMENALQASMKIKKGERQ